MAEPHRHEGDHMLCTTDHVRQAHEVSEIHNPLPCGEPGCIEEFGWPDERYRHLSEVHGIERNPIRIYDADGKNFPGEGIDLDLLQSGGEVIVLDTAEARTKFRVDLLVEFFTWLHEHTDTFDVFMMQDAIDTAKINHLQQAGFPLEDRVEMAELFVSGK